MVISVLNAITKQLGVTFGTDYHYYVEDVEQFLVKPCFTIDTLIPLMRSKNSTLYDRTFPIVIHFFNDDKNKDNNKFNCYKMAERAVECLEYLPYENTILRCEDISWQIVDDVLQIFVTYRFTTAKVKPTSDNMEEFIEVAARTN